MNILLNVAAIISTPSKEAVLFGLGFGFWIGFVVGISELITEVAARKLQIEEENTFKYWFLVVASFAVCFSAASVALIIWEPSYGARRAIFDEKIAELGFEHLFSLSILGLIVPTLSIGALRRLIRKANDSPQPTLTCLAFGRSKLILFPRRWFGFERLCDRLQS